MRRVIATVLNALFILMLVVMPVTGQENQNIGIGPLAANTPLLTYRSHVQNIGWMGDVPGGGLSGTTGRGLRLEAFTINLTNRDPAITGSNLIEYRARVRGIGWQNFVRNGQVAGTTGRSLAIEAIQIRLLGAMAERFDVHYQVHVANLGWLNWVRNGVIAGTASIAEVQAIRIQLVPRGESGPAGVPVSIPNVNYSTHVQNIGWQATIRNGAMAGTTGRSLRLEGIRIDVSDTALSGGIEYRTHVQNIGWQGFVSNGAVAGTTGRSLRLEAIEIRLTGQLANIFDVYYRVHVQNLGWLDWARNGQSAGSAGKSLRLEAIEIRLVLRGSNNNRPQNTNRPFIALAAQTGMRGLQSLETQLRTMINGFQGHQSIYVKNLNTNQYLLINNAQHTPASLVKLTVVGAAHEQIAAGRMRMTPQIQRWMNETITISTNESYNWLLWHIGEGSVYRGARRTTDFARRHGYTQTVIGHTLHPAFGVQPSPSHGTGQRNLSSVRDMGWFLEDVYRGGIVNQSASTSILNSMLRQQRLNKIPAGLPRGTRVANKTGEIPPRYEHDAAIVFSRGATYVIVVKHINDPNAIRNIRNISAHVYRHFN